MSIRLSLFLLMLCTLPVQAAPKPLSVAQKIQRALAKNRDVKAEIKVTEKERQIVLKGKAADLYSRLQAARIAKNLAGSRTVLNQVVIRPLGQARVPTDEQLKKRLQALFAYDSFLGPYDLQVSVEHAQARLAGQVPSAFHRSRAQALSLRVSGIQGLRNELVISDVKSVSNDAEIARRVHEALTRNPRTAAEKISVTAREGVISLEGRAQSWAAAKAASQIAFENGAKIVRNYLTPADLRQENLAAKKASPLPAINATVPAPTAPQAR